jgi:hypothetical protein
MSHTLRSSFLVVLPRRSPPYTTIGNAAEYWRAAAPVSVVGVQTKRLLVFLFFLGSRYLIGGFFTPRVSSRPS